MITLFVLSTLVAAFTALFKFIFFLTKVWMKFAVGIIEFALIISAILIIL